MQSKTKLILTLTVLTLVTLACATLTGGSNTPPQPEPEEILPTNTPLPPLPTSTPLPPEPDPETGTMITNGDLLFFDDFSDPTSGWDQFDTENSFADYSNGSYKLGVYTDTYSTWANPYLNFGNQIIDVQSTVTSTDTDNGYGIVCRHQDVENWYALVISSDGFAAIRKRYLGSEIETLTDWVQVSAINQGASTNYLHAECVGNRLSLFVNGSLALETYDDQIPSGDAGLIASTFDATSVEVLFDDFQVYGLPSSGDGPSQPEPQESPGSTMITGNEVLFFDDFSDPNSGWDQFTYDDGFTGYENGEYKIAAYKDNSYFWGNPYLDFGDQIIDVQTTVTSSEMDNRYGIVCRHQDIDNWYALLISSDGFAAIGKRYMGNDLEYITGWVDVPAIKQGTSTNYLHAECIGSRLTLFVNGTFAVEASDTDIPGGDAGLLAGTFDATSVEVLFDDFRVATP